MPYQLYHLVAFLVSASVVLWSTPIVRKIGLKSGRVDLPGDRKVHQRPMVRLGGVSIFAGTIIVEKPPIRGQQAPEMRASFI